MVALKLAMEIHDAQLDAATVLDIERALDLIEKEIRGGKARPIVKLTVAAWKLNTFGLWSSYYWPHIGHGFFIY